MKYEDEASQGKCAESVRGQKSKDEHNNERGKRKKPFIAISTGRMMRINSHPHAPTCPWGDQLGSLIHPCT